MSYGRSPGSKPGDGYPRRTARSTDGWRRALTRAQGADLEASLLEARLKTAGEDEARTIRAQIAAWRKFKTKVEAMSRQKNYQAAVEKLTDGIIAAQAELDQLAMDAANGAFLPAFVAKKRQEILTRIRVADGEARDLMAAYQRDARAEAAALRAKADAERDPAERLADEMERQRLARSPLDGEVFAQQAADMLAASQPKRAAFLLAVARDRGAKVTSQLGDQIEQALDEAIPERASARDIEAEVRDKAVEFTTVRQRALAGSLGVSENGAVGSGTSEERTRASVNSKMAAWVAAQGSAE